MENILIYRVIIVLLLMILAYAISLIMFYSGKRNEYKRRLTDLLEADIINSSHKKDNTNKLEQEIIVLKSLIDRLVYIIKSKPAILAKDKLRFTYSVRANGKRVARIKPIGDNNKTPTSVIGEDMVEVSKGNYISLNKLSTILQVSKDLNKYTHTEHSISELKQYNI